MLFSTVLSVAISVGGCEWPIFDRVVHIDITFWKFSNNPSNYASVVDAITFIIMMKYTCTVPFSLDIACISGLDFGPRKKYPPALLRACASEM